MPTKNKIFTVLSIISPLSMAGVMGAETAAPPTWDFSGKALYLQANSELYKGSQYFSANNSKVNLGTNDPWAWGFQLEAAYHVNSKNDVDINWYHYRSSVSNSRGPSELNYAYPGGTTISAQYNSSYSSASPQWDQANIEYGYLINFDQNKLARVHVGFDYSRVSNTTNYLSRVNYLIAGFPVTINDAVVAHGSYNGVGPRIGTDLSYLWHEQFNFYGKAAVAVLAGSAKSSFLGANVITLGYDRAMVVPEIDAKLGVTYSHRISSGSITADAGWLWVNYFNPIISANIAAQVISNQNNNFGIQGLYFGLKWAGDLDHIVPHVG